jgi:hypothetical protein
MSVNTVTMHLKNIYAKLGVSTSAQTVERAHLIGLLRQATRSAFPNSHAGPGTIRRGRGCPGNRFPAPVPAATHRYGRCRRSLPAC